MKFLVKDKWDKRGQNERVTVVSTKGSNGVYTVDSVGDKVSR